MTSPSPVGRLRPPPDAPVDAARLRAVHRAVSELRRGTPVLLAGAEPLVLLAVETVSPRGVAELAALTGEPPVMLLAPARAAAVLRRRMSQRVQAVAIEVADCLADAEKLRGLADPTMDQPIRKVPVEAKLPGLARPALALAKLARLLPAMLAARARPDAAAEAARLGLLVVSAADVLAYPSGAAASLRRVAEAQVPMEQAPDARVIAFRTEDGAIEHLAIVVGKPELAEAPLVRLHSECFTGDLLGSLRCDCGSQLRGAIGRMAEEGAGALLY